MKFSVFPNWIVNNAKLCLSVWGMMMVVETIVRRSILLFFRIVYREHNSNGNCWVLELTATFRLVRKNRIIVKFQTELWDHTCVICISLHLQRAYLVFYKQGPESCLWVFYCIAAFCYRAYLALYRLSIKFLTRLTLFLNLSLFYILAPHSASGSTFGIIMITWLQLPNRTTSMFR